MNSLVISVGKIIGILTMTVIIFSLIFSDFTNRLYWDAISNATNTNWGIYTLDNGALRDTAYQRMFDGANGDVYQTVD